MKLQLASVATAFLAAKSDAFPHVGDELRAEYGTIRTYNSNHSIHDYMPEGSFAIEIEQITQQLSDEYQSQIKASNPLQARQAKYFTDRLNNERFYYSSTVNIGTPPQPVTLLLDTGSSDTWVFTPQTKHRGSRNKPKSFFIPEQSKTFRSNDTTYAIQYGLGQSTGTWGTDIFQIGSAKIKDLSIGIASVGDVSQGLIGIGRPEAESTVRNGYMYQNLPVKLMTSGIINTAAYSLYLNDLNAKTGTIMFGAVDKSKYVGPLYTMPISHPKHLGVSVKSIATDGVAKKNILKKPTTAVLDSGTSLTYLEKPAMTSLHVFLNANPSFAIGQKYYCDCNVTKNIVMDFTGVQVKIPAYHFLWPVSAIVNPVIAAAAFPPNSCYIGIEANKKGMDFALIGDNFLRAMYVVYDLQHNKIAVAQANLLGGTPQVELITSKGIPGASGV